MSPFVNGYLRICNGDCLQLGSNISFLKFMPLYLTVLFDSCAQTRIHAKNINKRYIFTLINCPTTSPLSNEVPLKIFLCIFLTQLPIQIQPAISISIKPHTPQQIQFRFLFHPPFNQLNLQPIEYYLIFPHFSVGILPHLSLYISCILISYKPTQPNIHPTIHLPNL